MPTFSVVVPAYNAARTIGATLQSILAQRRTDFEVIVVDDGSTDATVDVVGSVNDSRIRLIRRPNAGVASARNTGIAVAEAPYVCFLDSDDLWLPDYLEAMLAALERDRDAGIAFTDAWAWDEALGRFSRGTVMLTEELGADLPTDSREIFRRLLLQNFFFVSTTVRREVLDDVGGFSPSMTPSEDWELWLRILARGYRAVRAGAVLAIYRVRAGSLSSSRSRMEAAEARVLNEVLGYDLDVDQRLLVTRRLAALGQREELPEGPIGRERISRSLPSFLRLRTYRIRPPAGVPPEIVRLLRASQGRS